MHRFQFHNPKSSQEGCFKTYMYYRALRKRQFIVSVVKHFTVNDENTICIVFQFHNPKLSQQECFKTYIHYTRLCTGYSTVKHFTENDENTICIVF